MQKGIAQVYLLIVLLIVGGLGGYYYLSKSSNKPVVSQTTPSVTPAKTADETANWKTYSNQIYSFKYPVNWILAKPSNESQGFYLSQATADIGGPGSVFIVLTYNKELLQITFDDPINIRKETGDKIFVTKIQNFTLDGKTAFRYKQEVLTGSRTDAQPEVGAYVDLGNSKVLKIMLAVRNDVDSSIFDQILTTFRFD